MQIASGWIGIDASAHLLVRWLPEPLLRALLRKTSVGEQATGPLKEGRFVFWDLSYGIPFADSTAQAVLSSHMLEHMTDASASHLLRECRRVLHRGGVLRVVVPEISQDDEDIYERSQRHLHAHQSRWTWPKLCAALESAGFSSVERVSYRVGRCPDLEILDNRPESLFVEGML